MSRSTTNSSSTSNGRPPLSISVCQKSPAPAEAQTVAATTKACNAAFASVVGTALQRGFSLTCARGLHSSSLDTLPEMGFLERACRTGAQKYVKRSEPACRALIAANMLECKRFLTEDAGSQWVFDNIPRVSHCFFSVDLPKFEVSEYISAVIQSFDCSHEAVIMALVYIDRLIRKGIPFTARSAPRMFLGALLVAVKTHDERPYSMASYQTLTGVPSKTLHTLELAMLKMLGYATWVDQSEFVAMLYSVQSVYRQTHNTAFSWEEAAALIAVPKLPVEWEQGPLPAASLGVKSSSSMESTSFSFSTPRMASSAEAVSSHS